MPEIDGYETTKKIKAFAENAKATTSKPIICAITGNIGAKFERQAEESGMEYVLSKPPNEKKINMVL